MKPKNFEVGQLVKFIRTIPGVKSASFGSDPMWTSVKDVNLHDDSAMVILDVKRAPFEGWTNDIIRVLHQRHGVGWMSDYVLESIDGVINEDQ